MSLLRSAIRSNFTLRTLNPSCGLPLFLRHSPRRFSTEAEQPPPGSAPEDPIVEPFLQNPSSGLVYGKLSGIGRHTLKTDIINLLEGCRLNPDDVKVVYNRGFLPMGMMLQFPSPSSYQNANRVIQRKGRLYKLERSDRSQWDLLMPYDGKTVVLAGIPQNGSIDDIERFLSGCVYDSSSIQIVRQGPQPSVRMALIRFPSRTEAMNAFITKNRGFFLNNKITVRVLQ